MPLRSKYIVLTLLGLTLMGCDSNDGPADAELFVGTWVLVNASDDTGDLTSALNALVAELRVVFDADGSYLLILDQIEGEDVRLNGPFTVSEGAKNVSLTVTLLDLGSVPLSLGYDFKSDNSLEISGVAGVLNQVFQGIQFTGTVRLLFERR